METAIVQISEKVYQALVEKAKERDQSPDEFVEDWLAHHLFPQYPHVEVIDGRSGSRAVVRGTRVAVDVLVGYNRAGYTPEQIATELLPHLTMAQVHDALAYYYDHIEEIEVLLEANSTDAWQERLRQRMSKEDYATLTGGVNA